MSIYAQDMIVTFSVYMGFGGNYLTNQTFIRHLYFWNKNHKLSSKIKYI